MTTNADSTPAYGKASTARVALIAKVARMYHEEKLLQPEIGQRLSISQSSVSRLLKEAEETGITRTIVVTPPGVYSELERELRQRYDLQDATIAEAPAGDRVARLLAIGAAAARYLELTLHDGERIGITSRSSALHATIQSLAPLASVRADVVVQTLGAVGSPLMRAEATRLTDRLAQLTGGEAMYLTAPGVVASGAVRDGLLEDPYIADAARAWKDLTLVLAGVGALPAASPAAAAASSPSADRDRDSALPADELDRLRAAGAVGDICLNFFDAEGRAVAGDLHSRIVGISADELRAVPRRLAVAGGAEKVDAIHAALRGRWINVLITDHETGQALLDLPR